ncbi:MAG: hypothetical protein RXO24_05650 [Acidilobus sp.]
MGYAEKVEEAYDEYRDVDRDFEEFIASTDRLRDVDKFPLLVSLGELYDIVTLLIELSTVDESGRYIEEDFVIGKIQDATDFLMRIWDAVLQGDPDTLAEEDLHADVDQYAANLRGEVIEALRKALERARQEAEA